MILRYSKKLEHLLYFDMWEPVQLYEEINTAINF